MMLNSDTVGRITYALIHGGFTTVMNDTLQQATPIHPTLSADIPAGGGQSTSVEVLSCNKFGAPLEVSKAANFVTCAYCHSQLAIKRTGTAAFTEVLTQIEEHTQNIEAHTNRMSSDLSAIRLQNELQSIDAQWLVDRNRFLLRGGRGTTNFPSLKNAQQRLTIVGIIMVFGVLLAFAGSAGSAGVILLIIGGLPLWRALNYRKAAYQYEEALGQYETAQQHLVNKLGRL